MNPPSSPPELTASELEHLKGFIARRGFGEPLVIQEILDHFACKVEEVRALHPELSLTDVMTEAHRQFGPAGFYPLVKAFEQSLAAQYGAYFGQRLKGIVTGRREDRTRLLKVLLLVAVVAALPDIFQSYLEPVMGADWKDFCVRTVWLLFLGIDLARLPKNTKRPNPYTTAAQQGIWGSNTQALVLGWILYILLLSIPDLPFFRPLFLLLTALYGALQAARYATLDKALEDYRQRRAHLASA